VRIEGDACVRHRASGGERWPVVFGATQTHAFAPKAKAGVGELERNARETLIAGGTARPQDGQQLELVAYRLEVGG
jgi:hypothetical protein